MKKIQLLILTMIAFSFVTNAQDSTALVAEEGINIPGGPTLPPSYASVQTLAGSNLRLTGDWTIEAWVKIGFTNFHNHIVEAYGFGNTGGFALRLEGRKVKAYQISNPTTSSYVTGTTIIPNNEWHHIAATLNETTDELKVYLDGVLEATTTTTLNTSNTNSGLYIGARGDDQQVSGIVEIDDVKIWSVAKTQAEIIADTLACFSGNEANLLAMYDFEDIVGNTLQDKTPNGNTGNLVNANFANRIYNCLTPVSSITVQGQGGVSTIAQVGDSLQIEANVLPATADDATYTWSIVNGTGSATINADGMLIATAEGTVTVTATANDGSGVLGSVTITINNTDPTVGIMNLANQKNVSLYPNPTKEKLFINSEVEIESILISNISGKLMKNISVNTKEIDVSNLNKGIYFIQIQSSEGIANGRFIKE